MKIGILTFHYGYNFGGVLQAYATQQVLKELGYKEVYVINCIAQPFKFKTVGIPRRITKNLFSILYLRFWKGRLTRKAFCLFRKQYLNETPVVNYKNIAEAAKDFDAIVVGSDQVWNTESQKHGLYFLNWKPQFNGKRISYAPCCGRNIIVESNRNELIDALRKFSSLSVRNVETQSFVKSLTGKLAPIVPDPTCLYDFKELLSKVRMIKEPYIFTYTLGKDIQGGNAAAIDILRKKYPGRKVIASVIAYANPVDTSWADEVKYDLSPIEWLNMIQYADVVYTDSFHGAIFSMKLNTPFVTFISEPGRMARFIQLQEQFGVQRYIVSSLTELLETNPEKRDYNMVFAKMSNIGRNYLKDSLTN